MEIVEEHHINVVTNQVSFSLIDTRPIVRGMTGVCHRTGVQLLCYGTLLGGLLADKWIGQPDPLLSNLLSTASLKKYHRFVKTWGGASYWPLFQELLLACRQIGDKHGNVGVSTVAMRWVLQQQGVGGVIVGARLGLTMSSHIEENKRTFSFDLDEEDLSSLSRIQTRGVVLPGDCGDEYRG